MTAKSLDAAISAISVTGLRIFSLSTMPNEIAAAQCPALFPSPNNWLGEQDTTPDKSFDANTYPVKQHDYTLAYRLAFAPAGSGRALNDFYSDMADMTQALQIKIFDMDQPMTAIRQVSVGQFGTIQDAAGNSFYGCTVTITARELMTKE